MQINIEGTTYTLPTSLMQITLQDRIDYDQTYGSALLEKLKKIIESTDEVMKQLDYFMYRVELAQKTISFFGKVPLEIAENIHVQQLLIVFDKTMQYFSEDVDFANKEFELIREFEWKGETWTIAPPSLNNNSIMEFGELLDSKQVVKEMYELGNNKMSALLGLCCVYFRKKDEPYDEPLSNPEGERMKLLKTLPFQYALHAGFFLKVCLDSWLTTFLSSEAEEVAAQNSKDTLMYGNG